MPRHHDLAAKQLVLPVGRDEFVAFTLVRSGPSRPTPHSSSSLSMTFEGTILEPGETDGSVFGGETLLVVGHEDELTELDRYIGTD